MSQILEKDETFKRTAPRPQGRLYREVSGVSAKRLLTSLPAGDWNEVFRLPLYTTSSAKLGKPNSVSLSTYTTLTGETMLGGVFIAGAILRLFIFQAPEAAKQWQIDMELMGGVPIDTDPNLHGSHISDRANFMYQWESNIFGEDDHALKVNKLGGFSLAEANKKVAGTMAEVISQGDAVSLIREIAKSYKMKNVEVCFVELKGGRLGSASPVSYPAHALPTGIHVKLAKTILYKHLILHEMAHAIDMWETGQSGHGVKFKEIYANLLNKFIPEVDTNTM